MTVIGTIKVVRPSSDMGALPRPMTPQRVPQPASPLAPQRAPQASRGLSVLLPSKGPFAVWARLEPCCERREVIGNLPLMPPEVFGRVLDIALVVDDDGQTAASLLSGVHQLAADVSIPHGFDPHAYVQWVLRDAYLLGSHQLLDYADRVRFNNRQRKTVRERLIELRRIKSEWVSLAQGAEDFHAQRPIDWSRLDENEIWQVRRLTAEEIAQQQANQFDDSSSVTDWLFGTSRLTERQREVLDIFINYEGSIGDDFSLSLIDEIAGAFAQMTAPELFIYAVPVLELLFESGSTDPVVGLLESLSPGQLLLLLDSAFGCEYSPRWFVDPFGNHYLQKQNTLAEAMHSSAALRGEVELLAKKKQRELSEQLGVTSQTVQQWRDEKRLWVELEAFDPIRSDETPANVDDSMQIDTIETLEDYIKSLEEKLTNMGDDSQLANIDLQEALQKQQQLMATMSNVSKMLHDTSMAMVRKVSQ